MSQPEAEGAGAVPGLSVVVPCCDEGAVLPELYRRLKAACRAVAGDRHELVFVNDGSRDRTWELIRELARGDAAVVGVDLSRHHGHQLALSAGLSLCRGKRVLLIDADLQDPPELLPHMMKLMDEGADVVYGQRLSRSGESGFKRLSASAFHWLFARLADVGIPPDAGDFRLISRRALEVLLQMPEQHRFVRGMVSWIGFRQVPIRYDRAERYGGRTKYPLARMLGFAMDAITSSSIRPLRLASACGALLALAALGLLGWAALRALAFGGSVSGWVGLLIAMLLLGSAQMLFLGLLGEYLGRLFLEARRRPLFVIREVVRGSEPPGGGAAPDPAAGGIGRS
jgi:dolichol-phosphate mannosyltransferase